MSSEFQPLFPVKGPKILVEGEETQEDTPNQLLFCTGAKILSTKSNISLRCNTTEKEVANPEISIVPTQIEKRLQKLDETIEGIDKVPSSNSSHSEVEHSKNITVMSQKGRCKQRND